MCFIGIDGPFPAAGPESDYDEYPTWFVAKCDDDGEPLDDGVTCFSWDAAWDTAETLAKPGNLEVIDDSSPL